MKVLLTKHTKKSYHIRSSW